MHNDCQNCPGHSNKNKYIVKLRVPLQEIGDYKKAVLENKLNNTSGIKDAIIKEKELIIDYDDILISPEKIKEILSVK